ALTFDPPACVVVPHPLWIAHLLHVIDGNLKLLAQASGAGVAAGPAAGPLPVGGHQDDRDVGDGGPRFDEGLYAGVLGDPLLQVAQIGRGVAAVGTPRLAATSPKPVEQSHPHFAPFLTSIDSARASRPQVCGELRTETRQDGTGHSSRYELTDRSRERGSRNTWPSPFRCPLSVRASPRALSPAGSSKRATDR